MGTCTCIACSSEKPDGTSTFFYVCFLNIYLYFIYSFWGKFVSPYQGEACGLSQPQEQLYPFLPVLAAFSCAQTMVWLPVHGILKRHADVDVFDFTGWLYYSTLRESALCGLSKEKSHAAMRSQTCSISISPGFLVQGNT